MSRRPIVLEALEVTKEYGAVTALDRVSLAVRGGSCVALVGESGSGKTTLLRCFNRMVEPTAGRVRVVGSDVSNVDPVMLRRSIGYVQQESGLLPHWTVGRNAALVPWLQGASAPDRAGHASLDLVGLDPEAFADRWPRELSGGQRQRAALARALAGSPEILLLDEPFGALDAITKVELQRTFGRLRRELEITALFVTHDLKEAFELSDQVVVMRVGRVEQVGRPDELRLAAETPYVAELLERAGVA